jgi:hypothetical protein
VGECCDVLRNLNSFQIFVGIESGHAAGTGGGHSLAIHVIGDIAGGKYPRYARRRCLAVETSFDHDVAAAHLELFLEELGVWLMAHRNEDTVHVQRMHCIAVHGVQPDAGDAGIVAQDFFDRVIPNDADFT